MEDTQEYYQQVVDDFTFTVYPFIHGKINASTMEELEEKTKLSIELANDYLEYLNKLKSTHEIIK